MYVVFIAILLGLSGWNVTVDDLARVSRWNATQVSLFVALCVSPIPI